MFALVCSRLQEEIRYLLIAVFLCAGSKVRVFIRRLTFTGKCCKKVCFCLCTCVRIFFVCHVHSPKIKLRLFQKSDLNYRQSESFFLCIKLHNKKSLLISMQMAHAEPCRC